MSVPTNNIEVSWVDDASVSDSEDVKGASKSVHRVLEVKPTHYAKGYSENGICNPKMKRILEEQRTNPPTTNELHRENTLSFPSLSLGGMFQESELERPHPNTPVRSLESGPKLTAPPTTPDSAHEEILRTTKETHNQDQSGLTADTTGMESELTEISTSFLNSALDLFTPILPGISTNEKPSAPESEERKMNDIVEERELLTISPIPHEHDFDEVAEAQLLADPRTDQRAQSKPVQAIEVIYDPDMYTSEEFDAPKRPCWPARRNKNLRHGFHR
eukprot:Nitzschia sp. Nitz4//scaffold52_size167869//98126//98950//NITZ4_002285-RA/size167869-processed-gene-0.133-mRNA-1//1//CDS//3329554062//7674//frame0